MKPNAPWTLDELCVRAAEVLSRDGSELTDGRVREVPDPRSVRYYASLGLVDRPAEMRGRTAYYGRKHLLQLVAIKRLQALGRSLAVIQQALLGLSEQELEPLAQLPRNMDLPPPGGTRERREVGEFWKTAPGSPQTPSQEKVPDMQALRLGPAAVLLVEAIRELREDDAAALRNAAAPLLALLRARGLLEDTR